MKPVGYIGIDPGAKGSICLLVPDANVVEFFSTAEAPINVVSWLVDKFSSYNIKMAMIEDVHSIHGTSAKSNFNFGFNVGILHGIFRSTSVGLDLVKPKVWQKYVGVPVRSKTIKQDVADICMRLYPTVSIHGPRGGLQDGKSDALMIAYYCYHKHK